MKRATILRRGADGTADLRPEVSLHVPFGALLPLHPGGMGRGGRWGRHVGLAKRPRCADRASMSVAVGSTPHYLSDPMPHTRVPRG